MSRDELLAWASTHAIPRVLGRRTTVRIGRRLLAGARFEAANDMSTNGELVLQQAVMAAAGSPVVVVDVGSHYGEWSGQLIEVAASAPSRPQLELHVFEPTEFSFRQLGANLASPGTARVTLNRAAASSRSGTGTIIKPHEGAGSSSLGSHVGDESESLLEEIELVTLDEYCAAKGVEAVALLKIDAEGHDLSVLEGASGLLARQAVQAVQFEYNWRWIPERKFLRDAFELLLGHGYELGKVTPLGLERHGSWAPEMESFQEANFAAVAPSAGGWFRWFERAT
jgi:FkbM family methyltransferase